MNIKGLRNFIDEKLQLVEDLKRKRNNCATFSYSLTEKEKDSIIKPEDSFEDVTVEVRELNSEICRLKRKLRLTNETICKNGESIADNIFLLRQIDAEIGSLKRFCNREKLTRSNNYTDIEFTELNYDVDKLKIYVDGLTSKRQELQEYIDMANLMTVVEI